jgi:hypothetical protein
MKRKFFILFFAAPVFVSAQRVIDVDKSDVSPLKGHYYNVAGAPVSMAKYVRVIEGSPFFSEAWISGRVFLSDGNEFDSILLRIDLVADETHFISKDGRELVAKTPIAEIRLYDSLTGDIFHFVHSSAFVDAKAPERGWYLLMVEGPSVLFKKIQKTVNESRPYGSATYQQIISTASSYFIFHNNSFSRIKKFSQLPEILNKKNRELIQYINNNKLSGKNESDYIVLVGYYNSLIDDK